MDIKITDAEIRFQAIGINEAKYINNIEGPRLVEVEFFEPGGGRLFLMLDKADARSLVKILLAVFPEEIEE